MHLVPIVIPVRSKSQTTGISLVNLLRHAPILTSTTTYTPLVAQQRPICSPTNITTTKQPNNPYQQHPTQSTNMSDKEFISTDNRAEQGDLLDYETNVNADKEDQAAAKSEETGQVSKGSSMSCSHSLPIADHQTRSRDSKTPLEEEPYFPSPRVTLDLPTKTFTP